MQFIAPQSLFMRWKVSCFSSPWGCPQFNAVLGTVWAHAAGQYITNGVTLTEAENWKYEYVAGYESDTADISENLAMLS